MPGRSIAIDYWMHEVAASGPETRLHANRTLALMAHIQHCMHHKTVCKWSHEYDMNEVALSDCPDTGMSPCMFERCFVLHDALFLRSTSAIVYTACCPWLIIVTLAHGIVMSAAWSCQ